MPVKRDKRGRLENNEPGGASSVNRSWRGVWVVTEVGLRGWWQAAGGWLGGLAEGHGVPVKVTKRGS